MLRIDKYLTMDELSVILEEINIDIKDYTFETTESSQHIGNEDEVV